MFRPRWSGGYLTPDLAVVTLGGETGDGEEWFRFHLIDVRTGAISGDTAIEAAHPYDMAPLGDGSWLTGGPDAHPVRWPHAPHPAD